METGSDSAAPGEYYDDVDGDVEESWTCSHRNGDDTHVLVVDVHDRRHLVLAVDVDGDDDPLASHLIDVTVTPGEAREKARQWMEENPKGIDQPGLLARLLN